MDPIIIINFKTYSKGTGEKALELAKICDKVAEEEDADIRLAVQATDLRMICEAVDIPVYSQHVDEVEEGSHTGWTLAETVREAGASGTLLNHSEHQLRADKLERCVERAKEIGLDVVICAKDATLGAAVKELNPDFVAVEPPELIGGDVSVSSARPELIEEAVEKIGGDQLLVGAGVKTNEDVKKSLEMGASGILVASGVVKADDPEQAVKNLVNV